MLDIVPVTYTVVLRVRRGFFKKRFPRVGEPSGIEEWRIDKHDVCVCVCVFLLACLLACLLAWLVGWLVGWLVWDWLKGHQTGPLGFLFSRTAPEKRLLAWSSLAIA